MIRQPIEPGARYGRLVAIEKLPGQRWLCRCDCGRDHSVYTGNLKGGQVRSCGCARRAASGETGRRNARHGDWLSVEYRTWGGMLARCRNPRNPSFENYGGRGVTVCERWLTYENFLADIGRRPEGRSLDRIDVNGNYEPNNCRWATLGEQAINRTDNRFIELDGERLTLAEWERRTGISGALISYRLRHKWTVRAALTKEPRTWR